MDRIVNVWDKCSKIAADFGLNVCWEFEPGFVFNKPSEIVQLVERVRAKGNNNFGVLYDTCHAHMCAVVAANQPAVTKAQGEPRMSSSRPHSFPEIERPAATVRSMSVNS